MTTDTKMTSTMMLTKATLDAPAVRLTDAKRVEIRVGEDAVVFLSLLSARSLHQQLTGVIGAAMQEVTA